MVQREASTWRSLEPIYGWHGWNRNLGPTVSPLVALFFEGATARGVRNRKAIAREIEIACVGALNGGAKVDILSIGGGAAPALREMMERVKVGGHVLILDRDEVPGADLNWLGELPCDWEYELRCADARELIRVLKGDWRPLVVEMVGVSDYMSDEKLLGLLRRVRRVMATDGWLIAANVDSDLAEKEFLRHMVRWPELIYRDREALLGLLAEAGFALEHAVLFPEPCGVFNIVAVPQTARGD